MLATGNGSVELTAETAPPEAVGQPVFTPLALFLLGENPTLDVAARGGSQSIAGFGDPPSELAALLHSVGLYDLGFRTRISVRGEDKFRWLNGMATNAVATLAEGHGNYNFILNAQGRIQGDADIYRDATRLIVETDRSQAARLMEHFERFIIMDDVELADLSETATALGLAGPHAPALLARLGIAGAAGLEQMQFMAASLADVPVTVVRTYDPLVPRFEIWFDPIHTTGIWKLLRESGATPAGLAAENALRVLEGTPLYGVDIRDRNLVQETSQTRALNFTKGCYLGQEIVERIRSRTTVHRFLRRLELTGSVPSQGAELRAPGEQRAAGTLTSVASYALPGLPATLALGYVRGDILDRKLLIEYDGGTATVLDRPPAIQQPA